jgi:hypothetical protein
VDAIMLLRNTKQNHRENPVFRCFLITKHWLILRFSSFLARSDQQILVVLNGPWLFKTQGTVAFRQARTGAKTSNEEVEFFKETDRQPLWLDAYGGAEAKPLAKTLLLF